MQVTIFRPRRKRFGVGAWGALLGFRAWTNGGPDCHYDDGRVLWYTYLRFYLLFFYVEVLFKWKARPVKLMVEKVDD